MTTPDIQNLVHVPPTPGPLTAFAGSGANTNTSSGSTSDAVGDMFDDLIGPDEELRPGWFDIALVVIGAALLALAMVGEVGTGWQVAGACTLALGLVLPLRAAIAHLKRRSSNQRAIAALASGNALNVSHDATEQLAEAYAQALEIRERYLGQDICDAAHAAVLEVATLLRGRTPCTPTELAYVRERVTMISRLVSKVKQQRSAQRQETSVAAVQAREHAVRAVQEVEAFAADSALHRMRALDQALDESPPESPPQ